jgi:hypothetical protein
VGVISAAPCIIGTTKLQAQLNIPEGHTLSSELISISTGVPETMYTDMRNLLKKIMSVTFHNKNRHDTGLHNLVQLL